MFGPIPRLQAAAAGVSGLGALSLLWGSLIQNTPPRLHLAALMAVTGLAALVLVARRDRAWSRWLAAGLSLAVFLAAVVLGGYDHLLKVVLVAHGLSDSLLASVIPPAFGPPGDLAYEALGIALLPLGAAGLTTLKELFPKGDEE